MRCHFCGDRIEVLGSPDKKLVSALDRWDQVSGSCARTVENVLLLVEAGARMPPKACQRSKWKPRHPLMPYQRQGVDWLHSQEGRGLLADEMGLGKTVQALRFLAEHPGALPAVVVCPASLKTNWRREVALWTPLSAHVIEGKKQYDLPERDVYIINYECLRGKRGKSWPEWLRRQLGGVKAVVLDEGHRIKNPTSQQTRATRRLCGKVPRVVVLSGTPVENRPAELYNAIHLIRPELFPSRLEFQERYCDLRYDGYRWVARGAKNTAELHGLLTKHIMLRRLKSDVLRQLPAKRYAAIPMRMDSPAAYNKAEAEFQGWIERYAPTVYEASQRLQQLQRKAVELKMNSVIEWTADFLENEPKLLLFAHHHSTVDLLTHAFKDCCRVVVGGTKDRQQAVDDFQNDPKVKLFIGSLAAAEGLTLTAASSVAFAELWWSPSKHDQATDRIHRIGQKAKSINVYYLLAQGTVEERMASLLDEKRKAINAVVDGRATEESELIKGLLKQYRRTK